MALPKDGRDPSEAPSAPLPPAHTPHTYTHIIQQGPGRRANRFSRMAPPPGTAHTPTRFALYGCALKICGYLGPPPDVSTLVRRVAMMGHS